MLTPSEKVIMATLDEEYANMIEQEQGPFTDINETARRLGIMPSRVVETRRKAGGLLVDRIARRLGINA